MIWGWGPFVPGWRWLLFSPPFNQGSVGVLEIPTSGVAVSTRENFVFVPELLKL